MSKDRKEIKSLLRMKLCCNVGAVSNPKLLFSTEDKNTCTLQQDEVGQHAFRQPSVSFSESGVDEHDVPHCSDTILECNIATAGADSNARI